MADRPLDELMRALRDFARDRSWEQFHTPKNLVMALAGEVGELVSLFQWLSEDESSRMHDDSLRASVEEEIGDVLIYLLRLADVLDVDVLQAAEAKLRKNAARYSVEQYRGTSRKAPHGDSKAARLSHGADA